MVSAAIILQKDILHGNHDEKIKKTEYFVLVPVKSVEALSCSN